MKKVRDYYTLISKQPLRVLNTVFNLENFFILYHQYERNYSKVTADVQSHLSDFIYIQCEHTILLFFFCYFKGGETDALCSLQ